MPSIRPLARVLFAFSLLACAGSLRAAEAADAYKPEVGQAGKDVIWVPTAQSLVDRMLDMAAVTPRDYVVDLGSGDGRTVITAAKRGARAHGIEYNGDMVTLSRRNAESEGVTGRATFEQADIFKTDFTRATVLTLFLLPDLNVRLRPTILDMKPGTRVVSNSFDMGDWKADETIASARECATYCQAYKWIVPAKVHGNWAMDSGELRLVQTYQMLSGTLHQGASALQISDAKMEGSKISFVAGGKRYIGEVNEAGRMQGTVEGGGNWAARRQAI